MRLPRLTASSPVTRGVTDPVSEKARAMQANRDCVLPVSPKPEVKLRRLDLSFPARRYCGVA